MAGSHAAYKGGNRAEDIMAFLNNDSSKRALAQQVNVVKLLRLCQARTGKGCQQGSKNQSNHDAAEQKMNPLGSEKVDQ